MSLIPFAGAVQKFNRQRSYQISRSLRFNSADTAYLLRTFASSGNRRTWTWSGWIKGMGSSDIIFGAAGSSGGQGALYFTSSSLTLREYAVETGSQTFSVITTAKYRDPSAWYHIVAVFDTTQATSSNRIKLYVNGIQVTDLSTASYPSLNFEGYNINNSAKRALIGTENYSGSTTMNGYQTEINFLDGQVPTTTTRTVNGVTQTVLTQLGEFDTSTGVWQPKKYTGSYGTNGFYLNFSDNSGTTAATLGKDSSGKGNNWTPNNFYVGPGSTNAEKAGIDSLVDTPTSYGTDTGAGGEVRGNYATLNPIDKNSGITLTNGNLDASMPTQLQNVYGTVSVTSGKWYWETTINSMSGRLVIGVGNAVDQSWNLDPASSSSLWGYYSVNGNKLNAGASAYGNSFTTNDVIGVAIDMDSGKIWFSKNGTWQASGDPAAGTNAAFTNLSGSVRPMYDQQLTNAVTFSCNFGQRPFAYTAPSGFKALCTQNLPEPTIKKGGEYFNTVLYTGNGSTLAVTGVGFQPDFVWLKSRGAARSHRWWDVLRGVTKGLSSDLTNAEYTESGLTAFDSNGFTLGSQSGSNTNAESFVAWNWKANGAGVINTAGTITSNVSVNTTAGFSIITYTGNGYANQTVGHGLGVAPAFGILKDRDPNTNNDQWQIFHTAAGDKYGYFTTAAFVGTAEFYPTSGSSTTVTIARGSPAATTNESGDRYVMYLFAPVAGYSAFGSYTGNNSATDGTFVYLGFRPRFLMIKSTSAGTEWVMMDTVRPGGNTYNLADTSLYANRDYSETTVGTVNDIDFLSNGFKLRNNTGFVNASQTYIYAAFAENPFKYSLAR